MGIEEEYQKLAEELDLARSAADQKAEEQRIAIEQRNARILTNLEDSSSFLKSKGFGFSRKGSSFLVSGKNADIDIICEGEKVINLIVRPKNNIQKIGYSLSEKVESIPHMNKVIANWIIGYA